MVDNQCTKSDTGKLLHAYELGILGQENVELFEMHLLKCEFCFAQVKLFEHSATLLCSKEFLQNSNVANMNLETEVTRLNALRAYLWPKFPFLLKPAVLLVILMALLLPVWNGLKSPGGGTIEQVKTITLVPMRSSLSTASVSKSESLVIKFVYQGAIPGKSYMVKITNERNDIVLYHDSVNSFDKFGSASLLLPASILSTGNYELQITDPEVSGQIGQQTYYFGLSIE